MLSKLIIATSVSSLFLLLAMGNPLALRYPQLWILFVIGIAAQVLQPAYKPVDTTAPEQDRGTANQIVWSVYMTQLVGFIESVYVRYAASFEWNFITTIALIGMAAGLALRTWSVRELGQFFTWHIQLVPEHRVVTSGPYRIIRHPAYSGALLLYVFTLVFLHAWISAALAPAVLMAAFRRRIRYEEAWLMRHLGVEYTAYAGRVSAMIPFMW
jgi:protein-S-isoprenylcysteine O-methyltransferase